MGAHAAAPEAGPAAACAAARGARQAAAAMAAAWAREAAWAVARAGRQVAWGEWAACQEGGRIRAGRVEAAEAAAEAAKRAEASTEWGVKQAALRAALPPREAVAKRARVPVANRVRAPVASGETQEATEAVATQADSVGVAAPVAGPRAVVRSAAVWTVALRAAPRAAPALQAGGPQQPAAREESRGAEALTAVLATGAVVHSDGMGLREAVVTQGAAPAVMAGEAAGMAACRAVRAPPQDRFTRTHRPTAVSFRPSCRGSRAEHTPLVRLSLVRLSVRTSLRGEAEPKNICILTAAAAAAYCCASA